MKDIYFELNYGKLYEEIENGQSIQYEFNSENGQINNLFILREIPIDLNDGKTYYDIITPYGYGGPIINDVKKGKNEELLKEYHLDFQKYCKDNNIVSEFIRFHPLFDNAKDFNEIYNVKYMRKTVGTMLKDFKDPFQAEFSKSTRKITRRALRDGVTYEVEVNPKSANEFIDIYYSTMDRNDANDYYYFDREYFEKCIEFFKENILLVKAIYKGKIIAMGFYLKYGDIIHSHLSGTLTEYLDLSPAYILKYATSKWGKENGYHLVHHGGGTSNDKNDGLYKFKKKFSQNTEFDFYIGTKVWNSEKYDKICEKLNINKDIDFFPAYRHKM